MSKALQLWVNVHYKEIRNVILAIVVVFFAWTSLQARADNRQALEKIKTLSAQNKQLSQDNKDLNSQNKDLAKKNQDYILCVAKIFADYTHDFVPVNIENFDTCTIKADNTSDAALSEPSNASSGPVEISSPNSTTPPNPSQSNNLPNEPEAPIDDGLLPDAIPILGPLL